jgi:hypothetical protein
MKHMKCMILIENILSLFGNSIVPIFDLEMTQVYDSIMLSSTIILIISLIFFYYPGPRGSEENQFTPLGDGVNKLIFKRFTIK